MVSRYIIVSTGESNSGGKGVNADATSEELASRPEVQMWNVSTETFENLDIGTNNNLDHAALDSTTHGLELQLANDVAAGIWSQTSMYYVQTGQGGSTVAEWSVGNGTQYWTKFLARIDAVKAYCLANDIQPIWIVWMSFGINDAIAGTASGTWITNTTAWINRIKTELPGCKVLMTEITAARSAYTAHIRTLCNNETDVTFVASTGCAELDSNHWNYAGLKTLSTRMTRASQIFLGLRDGEIFSNYSATAYPSDKKIIWRGGSGVTSATSKSAMDLTIPSWAVSWPTNAASSGIVVAIESTKDITNSWSGSQSFLGALYNVTTTLYAATTGTSTTNAGAMGEFARLTRSGDDLIAWKQVSSVWSVVHTFTGVLSGITQAWIHVINATTNAADEIEITVTRADTITISSPAADAIRLVGTEESVAFDAVGIAEVDILLSVDDGVSYPLTIATGITSSPYLWTPLAAHLSSIAKIKLVDSSDALVFAESASFKIATTEATGGGGGLNTALWFRVAELAQADGLEIMRL